MYAWTGCLVWGLVSLDVGYLVERDGWGTIMLCVDRPLILLSAFAVYCELQ